MKLEIYYENGGAEGFVDFEGHAKIMKTGEIRIQTSSSAEKQLKQELMGNFIYGIGIVNETDTMEGIATLRYETGDAEYEQIDIASIPDGLSFALVTFLSESAKKKPKAKKPKRLESEHRPENGGWRWSGNHKY